MFCGGQTTYYVCAENAYKVLLKHFSSIVKTTADKLGVYQITQMTTV